MVTLDELLDRGEARARAGDAGRSLVAALATGLYRVGWVAAKLALFLLLALGGLFYAVGWSARRLVWPALVWVGAAVKLGWEDGRRRAERG